jgi:hypothetical protein
MNRSKNFPNAKGRVRSIDSTQIAMTDNRHRGEPPPEAAPSAKTGRDRKERSGQEEDRQPTFEETRKEFLNLLWKWVPRRLRLPLVALIVIGAILVSTRSFWYPPLDSWLNKPVPYSQLLRELNSCGARPSDARTIYIFGFASDMAAPQKLITFQDVLGHKLRNGIRAHLESAGLLANDALEIKSCKATVRDEPDSLFVSKRLGCPGVISGYIGEENNELRAVVRFTTPVTDPPLLDYAQDAVGGDVFSLTQPNQTVNDAYLAFSSFILGTLYQKDRRFNLARQCFQHTKDLQPNSVMAHKADEILQSLQQMNPAKNLAPIGGPGT